MKFIHILFVGIIVVIISLANAQGLGQGNLVQGLSGGGGGSGGIGNEKDFYHFPAYKFAYGVEDYHTGDMKHQWEKRHGDHVEGEYTLKEADGTIRIVKYYANDKEGFNAVVKNIGKGYGQQQQQ